MREFFSGSSRRDFLGRSLATVAAVACLSSPAVLALAEEEVGKSKENISPVEDLMREHGVLSRALLVYDEIVRRIEAKKEVSTNALSATAQLIQEFVEDYHEKLEEEHVFPRFKKAGKHVELVGILLEQHRAGRRLTGEILSLSSKPLTPTDRGQVRIYLRAFCRMYRPHKAREDTVLFPAFRTIVSPDEYTALGEAFEEREHELFGETGFEKMVERIATIERSLGIYDLRHFTPKI